MATMRQAVLALLNGDATLTGLLPGLLSDASTQPRAGGGQQDAPREADGVRIRPYGKLRWRDSQQMQGDYPTLGAEQMTMEVYLYADQGYSVIDTAVRRVKALLHDQYIVCDDAQIAHFTHTFTSGELPQADLGSAPGRFLRFSIVHIPV